MLHTNQYQTTTDASERVKLNVGGSHYETYLATLQRDPDSLLGMMFADRNSTLLKQDPLTGEYFFDRNGRAFEVILDYCRTGKLIIPHGISLDSVREEMDFWQIGLTTSKPPSTTDYTPPELPNEDEIIPSKEELDFCDWLAHFATTATAKDFAEIFKRRRVMEEQQKPLNDLLSAALVKKGLGTGTISGPPSRRASLTSLSAASPLYTQASLFNQPLSPSMQMFLEHTLSIMADAKNSHMSQIKIRVDNNGELSGVPSQLERVASQKQYWITLSKLVQRCAGVSPPGMSAMTLGSDIRTQLQFLQTSRTRNQATVRHGPYSLPPLASAPGAFKDQSVGQVDSQLITAWQAAEELYEFRLALQERIYGKEEADAEGEENVKEKTKFCFDVISVRKSYPWSIGKGKPLEFLSHWEIVISIP